MSRLTEALSCALFVVLIVSGCGPSDGELIVDLRTDMMPGLDFDEVVTTFGEDREVTDGVRVTEDYTAGVRVAELGALAAGEQRVEVSLSYRGVTVSTRPVRVMIDGTVGVTVVISRDCRGVSCDDPGADACLGGRCVPSTCTPETPETCPADLACTADADCTGSATCATDRCESGACFTVADDGRCDGDQICAPVVGCQGIPTPFGDLRIIDDELAVAGTTRLDDATLTSDQLEMFFNAELPGGSSVWHTTRTSVDDPWSAAVRSNVAEADVRDTDPLISRDGLTLWVRRADVGQPEFRRPDRMSPFGAPMTVFDPLSGEADPLWVSEDGLKIVLGRFVFFERASEAAAWERTREGAALENFVPLTDEVYFFDGERRALLPIQGALHEISRLDVDAPWGPPQPVGGFDEDDLVSDIWVSEDGNTLYCTVGDRSDGSIVTATR